MMIYVFGILSVGGIVGTLWFRKRFLKVQLLLEKALVDVDSIKKEEEGKEEDGFSQAEMKRLSIVAKQTDNAIMIMAPNGDIEWINDGFTRMYEFSFEEFLAQRGRNILQTSFNPQVKERLECCVQTRRPVYYEAINITPSGREIWTHTSLTPIFDDEGEVIHLATIDSDISRRKEAGDALLERINSFTIKINQLSQQQRNLLDFTYQLMEEVRNSNKRINETDLIVKFIREMSDKIKIMGLNASIEAHSVGHTGNGFRVLSSEIVKMSEETKRYAQDIYDIVAAIKGASERLNDGKVLVEKASEKYLKAVDDLRYEVGLVEDVAGRLN